jgi:hypothetical protein
METESSLRKVMFQVKGRMMDNVQNSDTSVHNSITDSLHTHRRVLLEICHTIYFQYFLILTAHALNIYTINSIFATTARGQLRLLLTLNGGNVAKGESK